MPQLDTIHMLITFLWTWLMLCLMNEKMKAFKITSKHPKMNMTKTHHTMMLPWT